MVVAKEIKSFLVGFIISIAFVVVPLHFSAMQVNLANDGLSPLLINQKGMYRAIDLIGGGGGGVHYYSTAMTPLIYEELPKVVIKIHVYSVPIVTGGIDTGPIIVGYYWFITYWIYDEKTGILLYSGSTVWESDKEYNGEIRVKAPSPFYSDTHIYYEYIETYIKMKDNTQYEVHGIEGASATLNTFLNELRGNITSKPKYFHFAGHGGLVNDIPYILVRDDNFYWKYEKLFPFRVLERIKENDLVYTKLVYLSACYSLWNRYSNIATDNFVIPILKYGGAQNLIGFTDVVDSRAAAFFAEKFYEEHLEEDKHISEAFDSAKSFFSIASTIFSFVVGLLASAISYILELPPQVSLIVGIVVAAATLAASLYLSLELSKIVLVTKSDLE